MSAKTKPVVATHSGSFHADEIFAVATLKRALKKDFDLIRTRDKEKIEKADYVVDVGGVYDASRHRYDHHQKGGAGVRENGIPYSSFGLVWKHFGAEASGSEEVARHIEQALVLPIDANDCGVDIMKPQIEGAASYDLPRVFHLFRRPGEDSDEALDRAFVEALRFAEFVLEGEILYRRADLAAMEKIEKIYRESSDPRLLVLSHYLPWENAVMEKFSDILFVIYPKAGTWRLRAVRSSWQSFASRALLPSAWGGKMGEELEEITGVRGAKFSHLNGHLAVAESKEGALRLAEMALSEI